MMSFKKLMATMLVFTLSTGSFTSIAATNYDTKEVIADAQTVNASNMNVSITSDSGKQVYTLSNYNPTSTIYDLNSDNDSYKETVCIEHDASYGRFKVAIPVSSNEYFNNYEIGINGVWTEINISHIDRYAICKYFNSSIYTKNDDRNWLYKRVLNSDESQNYLVFDIWQSENSEIYNNLANGNSFQIRIEPETFNSNPKIIASGDYKVSVNAKLEFDSLGIAYVTLPEAADRAGYKFDGYAVWGDDYSTDNGKTFKYNASINNNPYLENVGTKILVLPGVYNNNGHLRIHAMYSKVEATPTPTTVPSTVPSTAPTTAPTTVPSTVPTTAPTTVPTTAPTTVPSTVPTTAPTTVPSTAPTTVPSNTVQVIILSDGGTFANGTNALIKNYAANSIQFISSADFPTKEGYVFDGFTSAYGKDLTYINTDNTYLYIVPEYNDILTAKWKEVNSATIAPTTTATTVPTSGAITTTTPAAIATATPTAVVTETPSPTATATTVPTIAPTVTATTIPTVVPTATATTPVVIPTPETPNYPVITLNKSNITLGKGEKTKVTVKSAQTDITYKSGNQSVATINANGQVTAKGKGTAYIFVTANNITKKVKVTVKAAPTKVSAKKKTIKLKKGKKATIKYSLSKGSCGKVTFSSSNKKVVSVSSAGKITAKKKGTAKIKIKTYNGKTAVVKVIVK